MVKPAVTKKPYTRPVVTHYGDIASLTAGSGPGGADAALGLGTQGNPSQPGGGGGGGGGGIS